ncbi:hypothetical protein Mnod_5101 [Methylobacterium nodulans ORS 2060]|uniref:Uncharacterized protein n=1 Tax=Methylobacterium nodulans (strain LMG 21967 / CNCM I-2342 / ORS 2060) TaxID=460265 RepID=B8IIS0_METNO|nr:hypothetical protein Mnod_5101 [Methylobacterium nodulans ORS 2060]
MLQRDHHNLNKFDDLSRIIRQRVLYVDIEARKFLAEAAGYNFNTSHQMAVREFADSVEKNCLDLTASFDLAVHGLTPSLCHASDVQHAVSAKLAQVAVCRRIASNTLGGSSVARRPHHLRILQIAGVAP